MVDFSGTAFTVTNHRVCDSIGNLTSETNGSVSSLFGFTGKLFDKDFKLSNHWNRWYDPALGKWISEDPIGFAAGDANLGRYGANNPAKYIDPDGYDIVTPSYTNSTSQFGENDGLGYGAGWTTPFSELDFIAGQQARQAEADRQARQWQELLENYHNDGGWWDNYWAAWQGETPRVDILDSGLYYGGKGSRIVGIGAGTAAAVITTGGGILAVGAPGTAVTSTSVLTAVGGGAVVAYEIDVGQAAIRSEIAGHQVDSFGGGLIQDALGRETKAGQVGSFVDDNANLLYLLRGRGIRGDAIAPSPGAAADFVDMTGRVPGTIYDSAKLGRLERYLGRRGVTLKVGDEFVPDGAAGAFSRDGTTMVLRSNPTQYEVWHELSHFRHSQKIGREAYSKLPRTLDFNAPEQHVFDLLENSPWRWNSMNFEQQQHAIDYIERIGGFR